MSEEQDQVDLSELTSGLLRKRERGNGLTRNGEGRNRTENIIGIDLLLLEKLMCENRGLSPTRERSDLLLVSFVIGIRIPATERAKIQLMQLRR